MSAVCSVCVHLFLDSAQLKVLFLSTALVCSVISSTRLAYGIQTQTLAAIIETGESVVHDWTWSPRGWVTITCCCYYKLLVLGIAPTPRCWVLFRIYKSPSDETIIVLTDPQCVVYYYCTTTSYSTTMFSRVPDTVKVRIYLFSELSCIMVKLK